MNTDFRNNLFKPKNACKQSPLLKASMSNILTLKQLKFEAAEKEALQLGEMRTWCTTDMTKKVTKVGGYNNPHFQSTG